jgi:hypothetical protein
MNMTLHSTFARVSRSTRTVARSILPEPIYRTMRGRRIQRKIARYRPRVVEHTYAGHSLRLQLRDPLGDGWYDHDWWDTQPELELLKAGRLRPGAIVFDLGAHQGVVALILAREVGHSGVVVAVEAAAHNAAVAEENRVLNGADNVTILHAAGGAETGSLWFSNDLNGRASPRRTTRHDACAPGHGG